MLCSVTSDRHWADGPPVHGVPSIQEALGRERRWIELSTAYWRERVAVRGRDEDYVGLVRMLLQAHSQGVPDAVEDAYVLLREAAERHPRAVAVWEHLALVAPLSGRSAEMDEVLAVIERLDPTSRVLAVTDDLSPESVREWSESASVKQAELFTQAQSADSEVAHRAVAELERWARAYPENSTYVVNYVLALFIRGRLDEARVAALSALSIEDGSFADAFNLGQVLLGSGERDRGLTMLHAALDRAASDEERELVEDVLAREAR